MKPFRERNPLPIGAVGLAVVGAVMVGALYPEAVPFVGGGTTYTAQFREAGGLTTADEVRVAGVRVGAVEAVELDGSHVRVDFSVESGHDELALGRETGASIRIKTLLGRKYLSLEPAGDGALDPDAEIPLTRTVAPYDVVDAFSDLASTTERIDTDRLATALDTLAETFENTPDDVRASLDGLSRLSKTVASRDDELHTLLEHANDVTAVLSDRDEDLVELMRDTDLLLVEIRARRDLIHEVLVTSQELSDQLVALVRENREHLTPTLKRLRAVIDTLEQNQDDLERSIELLGPFVRVFANTLGTGPWFDTYIPNLVPLPASPNLPLPDGWERSDSGGGG